MTGHPSNPEQHLASIRERITELLKEVDILAHSIAYRDPLMSRDEAARALRVSLSELLKMEKRGEVHPNRDNRRPRYRRSEIERIANQQD